MVGIIRQVIREELKHTHFVSENPVQAEADEIPVQMLDFLSAMETFAEKYWKKIGRASCRERV